MKKNYKKSQKKGFTLVESLISLAIFVLLIAVVYATSTALIRESRYFQEYTTISGLADQYLEVARNLPYSQVGTLSGNPHGTLPDLANLATATVGSANYKIYYAVTYIDDPADGTALAGTDPAPNDYKQIKLYITNTGTNVTSNFSTNIVPKGLENINNAGALYIKVFDAVGQPVPNATIHITNTTLSPTIDLTRQTDSSGNWVEVGLPDSANNYHIVAAKAGYSSDQTYPVNTQNPNPIKNDATVSNGQVTQISFSIDRTSTLVFNTQNQTCVAISGVGMEVAGAKLIGTPNILKFDRSYTSDSNGKVTLTTAEWDTYMPTLTGSSLMVFGSSPIQQVTLLPNTNQQFTLILGPKTTNSLLVAVKDSASKNAIENASVELQKDGINVGTPKITGGSIWSQDLSSGLTYSEDDGHINITGTPSGLRLASSNSIYEESGSLTSSTFDTGTASTSYTTINWQPTSQDPSTSLKFQIASNNDGVTWNFVGPDGSVDTYYTVPGTTISSTHKENRYARYKVFLSTTDTTKTPVLTNVSINYVSGCSTPGQVIYPGLSSDGHYSLTVSASGYQTKSIENLSIDGNNVLEVSLNQ